MIRIENNELVFTLPAQKTTVLRRRAEFAHTCPRCGSVIHALMHHDPERKLERMWRTETGHPQEIDLGRFAEGGGASFIVPPDYTGSIIALANGLVGQFFFDKYHFSQFGYRYHGRCKYTRGIFQFTPNVRQAALRLMGILKSLYGTDEPKWVSVRDALEADAAVAEMVAGRIRKQAGIAPDALGGGREVVLLSKEDWDFASFNELVDGVLEGKGKEN